MKTLNILLVFLLLFNMGAVKIMANDIENLLFSEEEMIVLNLAIDRIMNVMPIPDNETILINRTIDFSRVNVRTNRSPAQIENSNRFIEQHLNDITEELWQSLHSHNSQRYVFSNETRFNLQNYRLVNIGENDRRGNLNRGEHYPLLSFSRIGFNIDRTEALIEINYFFPRAGSGYIVHLKKENNNWNIAKTVRVRVS